MFIENISSWTWLFQASFVATTSNPAVPKATQFAFQNPEVLPSKLQQNPAIPNFVSEPPELYHGGPQTFTPQLKPARSDASVKTSYSQSFHLAIGNHGQEIWNLSRNLRKEEHLLEKFIHFFRGGFPCVFWSAVRWCILWISLSGQHEIILKKGNLSNTLVFHLYGGKIIYDLVSYDLVDVYHMWKNLSNTSWALFH